MAYDINKVIKIAEAEVGYLEKKSNSNLDSKTANAGYNNYTKYARDFDNKYPNFYNYKKQTVQWCDMFVDWCFVTAYGEANAKKLLCQPSKSCGAGCHFSRQYYKDKGQFYTTPKVGDQIFFYNSKKTEVGHTGLVYKVDNNYVYTIEGNTSSASGVVANGGAVEKKKYSLNYRLLAGYGRPNYGDQSKFATATKPTATTNNKTTKVNSKVKSWQEAAMKDGYKQPTYFTKGGADGEWGPECEAVAKKAICKKPLVKGLYTNKNLTKFLQKQLGIEVDGKFWNDTKNAVIAYQKKKGLEADGIVGIKTWKKILGV